MVIPFCVHTFFSFSLFFFSFIQCLFAASVVRLLKKLIPLQRTLQDVRSFIIVACLNPVHFYLTEGCNRLPLVLSVYLNINNNNNQHHHIHWQHQLPTRLVRYHQNRLIGRAFHQQEADTLCQLVFLFITHLKMLLESDPCHMVTPTRPQVKGLQWNDT